MEYTFTALHFNIADSTGEVFMPGSVKPRERDIYVLKDFDPSKVIGVVKNVEERGNELVVTADLSINPKGLYPAVGFRRDATNKRISDAVLFCIGLSKTRNQDSSIKPL